MLLSHPLSVIALFKNLIKSWLCVYRYSNLLLLLTTTNVVLKVNVHPHRRSVSGTCPCHPQNDRKSHPR